MAREGQASADFRDINEAKKFGIWAVRYKNMGFIVDGAKVQVPEGVNFGEEELFDLIDQYEAVQGACPEKVELPELRTLEEVEQWSIKQFGVVVGAMDWYAAMTAFRAYWHAQGREYGDIQWRRLSSFDKAHWMKVALAVKGVYDA
jgi:hypothetical protein